MTRGEAVKILKEIEYPVNGDNKECRDIAFDMAIKALEQEPKTEQFAKWVATEIFDDMWDYNKDAFAEIACRKLAKLGIVRAKGDEWEMVEPQESEVEDDNT